jgi:hypothetical protein
VNAHIIPDALADALGRVVADFERQQETRAELWQARAEAILTRLEARERDIEAEIAAGVEARVSELLERSEGEFVNRAETWGAIISDRIATVKDGEQGPPGERGEPGEPGQDGTNGRDGVDGKDGKDGEPGRDGIDGSPGEKGETGDRGEPGEAGPPGERGHEGLTGMDGRDGADGKEGRDGLPGVPGRDGRDGADGATGERGERGEPGEKGERGQDGKSFVHRGTYDLNTNYQMGDVVVRDSSSFVAISENPGALDAEDGGNNDSWRLIAGKGKRGERGEPGRPGRDGTPGKDGRDGASVIALRHIDGLRGSWIRDDGEEFDADLEPFFRAYHEQVTR